MHNYIMIPYLLFILSSITVSQEYFIEHTLSDSSYAYEIKYKLDYFGYYPYYTVEEPFKSDIIQACSCIDDITPNKTNDGIIVFSQKKISDYEELFDCSEFFHFFIPNKMEMDSRSKISKDFKIHLYQLVYQKVYPPNISFNYPVKLIKDLDQPFQVIYKARDYSNNKNCVRKITIDYSTINSFSVNDAIDYNIAEKSSYDYRQLSKSLQYNPDMYGSLEVNLAYPALADCNYWTIRLFEGESYIWEYTSDLTCLHFVEVFDFDNDDRDEIILFHGGLGETVLKIFKRK